MLYAICFISKKLEGTVVSNILMRCGRESFYIMGLHIIGFRLCTVMFNGLGIVDGGMARLMTPAIENNILLLAVYTFCGIAFPIAFMHIFRKLKITLFRNGKLHKQ